MTGEPSRLTERARQCLRLAYNHRSPEQIAEELGISVSRVNQHFAAARTHYRVGRTALAAQKLAEEEGLSAPSHPIAGQESTVPPPPHPRFRWPLRTERDPHNDLTPMQILAIGFAIALAALAMLAFAGTVLETAQHMTMRH